MRVLKPAGSIFMNIGDRHATRWSSRSEGTRLHAGRSRDARAGRNVSGVPEKSLIGIPWRYAIACMDDLGLALRAAIVWHKPNAMPESVRDRVATDYELILHLTMQRHYYHATDLIREPHTMRPQRRPNGHKQRQQMGVLPAQTWSTSARQDPGQDGHPLGRMPRSVWPVWEIPTVPLHVPEGLDAEHYAAWPPAIPRRIITGWSPREVCTACGQGRFPVSAYTGEQGRHPGGGGTYRAMRHPGHLNTNLSSAAMRVRGVIGYACACTPFTDQPGNRKPTVTPGRALGRGKHDNDLRAAATGSRHHGSSFPDRGPAREYHWDQWDPAPATPGVVLDPFGGTGVTAMVADVLGRRGISADLSSRYLRLARWRTADPGERAAAKGEPRPAPVPADQPSLDDLAPPGAEPAA